MWRLSPLTGWVKKHSGSSGQLAGVHLPQGRPGRASHQAPQGVGERARHSSHRSVHGADAEVPGERQGASEVGSSSGKGSSSREKRVARGVGIAAVQFKRRRPKQLTTCTANEVHRDGSAKAGASESSTLSSLLATRMGGGGLTEALIRARRCLAASQTPPGGS